MALRAIKSPSRFARHTGQSPTRNVYHISVRMLPGSSGGRPMLCRALAPTSSPGWAGASCAPLPRPAVVSWPLVAQVASGSRPLRLRLACCVRSRARPPPLLRSPGPSLGSLGPFRPSPGPGLPCLPPALSLGPCARCALRGRSLAPSACGPALVCAAGSLFGRPCVARACALCSAWPRGGPLRPRFAASGPGAPRPAPVARPLAALFLRGGRASGCARGPARACCASPGSASCAAWVRVRGWLGFAPAGAHRCSPRRASGVLPASPPPLPPRWGSRGARGLRPECRFSRPSRGCAAGCGRPPVRHIRRGSQSRNCKPGLDFPLWSCYSCLARPVPLPFGGCSLSIRGRQEAPHLMIR